MRISSGFNVKHKDDFSSVVINDEVLSNQSIADLVNDSLVALTDKVPELNKDILAIMAYTFKSNQIKSFNVYKAAHSQYTQCDKIQLFHVCAVKTQSIKANPNHVQLCKTHFAVAGQQI